MPFARQKRRIVSCGALERVAALEPDEERPRGHEEARPALPELAVHLLQVLLRALPAGVGVAPHVDVPARSSRGRDGTPRCGRGRSRRRASARSRRRAGRLGHVLAVEDPVVDVLLPCLERGRLVRVVQDERVDDEVGLVGQDLLERSRTAPESRCRAGRVAHLHAAGRPRLEQAAEDARGRVLLLHALPLGERVAEDHHTVHARRLRAERPVAEAQRVVAGLDCPGVVTLDRVEAMRREVAVARVVLRRAQVDVEVATRVRGVAVEQSRPAPVEHASARHLATEAVANEAEHALEQHQEHDRAAGGEHEALQHRARTTAQRAPPTAGAPGAGGPAPLRLRLRWPVRAR